MQFGIDEAAEHDGHQGQGKDAQPVHHRTHETAGFLGRGGGSFVSFVGHSSIPSRAHAAIESSKFYARPASDCFLQINQPLALRLAPQVKVRPADKLTLTKCLRADPSANTSYRRS